jgi:hypothetical protein
MNWLKTHKLLHKTTVETLKNTREGVKKRVPTNNGLKQNGSLYCSVTRSWFNLDLYYYYYFSRRQDNHQPIH